MKFWLLLAGCIVLQIMVSILGYSRIETLLLSIQYWLTAIHLEVSGK